MEKVHLWPEETIEVDSSTTVRVTVEQPKQSRLSLFYRIPSEYSSLIAPNCDAFVVATQMKAMSRAWNMVVHGEVSPSLLQNLTEFQAAWTCWRPNRYQSVQITAEVERELPTPAVQPSDHAIAAFSGGVDSCFTLFRHLTGQCGRLQRPLKAGLMVHGFDIPLDQPQVFQRAAQRSRQMLASLGVELIPMATNFRELRQNWEDAHGTGLVSCLMLLQGGYGVGLVPSTEPYQTLIPWGSNPVTDHLLSSRTFQVIHDGAAFTRIEKVEQLGQWQEALTGLRVCWQGQEKDRNCGRCEKCIRTILNFRVVGLGLPACFENDIRDEDILRLQGLNDLQLSELEQIYRVALARSISASWVEALHKCIQRNRSRRQVALNQLKLWVKARLPEVLRESLSKLTQ